MIETRGAGPFHRSLGLTLSSFRADSTEGLEGLRNMGRTERDSATQRLDAAVQEQDRVRALFDSAVGTSGELGAYSRLRAAGQEVRARQAWVDWVGDDEYRGLNAGPFELLTQRADRTRVSDPC